MPRSLPPILQWLLTEEETGFEETTLQGYRSAWRDLLRSLDPVYERNLEEATAGEEGATGEEADWEEVPEQNSEDAALEDLLRETDIKLPLSREIAEYLRDNLDLAWSTLTTRRQAFQLVYDRLLGIDPFDDPEVEHVWSRIREEKRQEPRSKEKRRLADREYSPTEIIEEGPALLFDHLRESRSGQDLEYLPEETAYPEDLIDDVKNLIPSPTFELAVLRDRALLLLVATTSAPRKALVGIDIEDIYPLEGKGDPMEGKGDPTEGKGDPTEGKGDPTEGKRNPTGIVMYGPTGDPTHVLRLESLPEVKYCTNRAVAAWILAAELAEGPLFRSFTPHGGLREDRIRPQTINRVIKRRAEEAGLNPADWSSRQLRQ